MHPILRRRIKNLTGCASAKCQTSGLHNLVKIVKMFLFIAFFYLLKKKDCINLTHPHYDVLLPRYMCMCVSCFVTTVIL